MSEAREHEHLWLGDLRKMPDGQARLYSRGGRLISGAFAWQVTGNIDAMLADAEQRAERAEAELAALRERVRGLAWTFEALGKHAHADGLRDLLDDDTTGAASGEGEK